jgi:hypothetical protein
VIRYVLDHSLIAGLGNRGTEHDRREFSRLVHDAVNGGPSLDVPALCLAAAAVDRPEIAGHVAGLVLGSPPGVLDVHGLTRSALLEALRSRWPLVAWPAAHAAVLAVATGHPIITAEPHRYAGTGAEAVAL